MDKKLCKQESEFYYDQLVNNILPFWLKHSRDDEYGGYITCLNRDGSVFDYDKRIVWAQPRFTFTFGLVYNELEQRPEWLDMALHGIDFLRKYGFDEDGRMYYSLKRDGTPLAKTQDMCCEFDFISGLAECYKATGDKKLYDWAKELVFRMAQIIEDPHTNQNSRLYMSKYQPISLSVEPMILLNALQRLREIEDDPNFEAVFQQCLQRLDLHYKPDKRCLLEAADLDGTPLPGQKGTWTCPGHTIELGWFLIHEAHYRNNDKTMLEKGINCVNWGMEWGWDDELGGIFNDVDIEGRFCLGAQVLYAPIKMWWAVLEAMYANALVYTITGDDKYMATYKKIKDWSFKHFADDEYGEWYGYLDSGCRIIDARSKGTDIKNCYHIGRTFYLCHKLFGEWARNGTYKPQLGWSS